MFARSTRMTAEPITRLDPGLTFMRDDLMPTVMDTDGCLGTSLVADRVRGATILTVCWASKDAMKRSDDRNWEQQERGAALLGGEPEVQLWEIALFQREHGPGESACCRITWGLSANLDTLVDRYRDSVMPPVATTAGFCSASLFVDRGRALMCSTVTYDSSAALQGSRKAAASSRLMAADTAGVVFLEIGEYELLEHQLRIPDLV